MPEPKISPSHEWVAATHVTVDDRQAKRGMQRGSLHLKTSTKIEILDVYCVQCRRPYDQVADQECIAASTREHLIGGPEGGARAPRKHRYHDCAEVGCDTAEQVARRQAQIRRQRRAS